MSVKPRVDPRGQSKVPTTFWPAAEYAVTKDAPWNRAARLVLAHRSGNGVLRVTRR